MEGGGEGGKRAGRIEEWQRVEEGSSRVVSTNDVSEFRSRERNPLPCSLPPSFSSLSSPLVFFR